ncbi:F-box domain-containing protein [Pseudomassariella vexata]|uniref:F-box domain-containing protein n=1 Tax=Pseudomassariella vexata TaxID=1141098 RepID=A0A1Y2DS92_9PEZI|nr:F-box domain-containing protein [Pseudomassariella vexata]ORY62143.1 F-box domain-containing protein [Pseudomassariella vexata]
MLLSPDGLVNGASNLGGAMHGVHAVHDAHESTIESSEVIPVHPLGVKPLGNQYFATGPTARQALGSIGCMPDEMILQLLEYLDAQSLRNVGSTCKFLRAFCHLEELWKALFLELQTASPGPPSWKGSWRSTVLQLPAEAIAQVECNNVFSDVLHRPFECSHIRLSTYISDIPRENQITRLESLTHDEFERKWSDKPFILANYIEAWPVYKTWSIDGLGKRYPDVNFRAEAVDWPFSAYRTYMDKNDDESPLYLFDKEFAEKTGIDVGQHEGAAYWPPECFGEDLFELLAEERPAHRWLIVGPESSGSTFHKDPNATSAWNAVIQGSKYWLMFPPSVPQPPGVFVSEDSSEVTSPLSIAEYLLSFHAEARKTAGCLEGICRAGEVLFVPSGWWHLVVNIEPGVALTQNFVTKSQKHLTQVLSFLKDKPDQVTGFSRDVTKPYELFVERLQEKQPSLLNETLQEMERKSAGRKRRWEEAVGSNAEADNASGGFSFGFGADDDDDIP